MNELLVRNEGGWPPPNTLPYYEDLLRFTLGLSPRVKSSEEFYPDPNQFCKGNYQLLGDVSAQNQLFFSSDVLLPAYIYRPGLH